MEKDQALIGRAMFGHYKKVLFILLLQLICWTGCSPFDQAFLMEGTWKPVCMTWTEGDVTYSYPNGNIEFLEGRMIIHDSHGTLFYTFRLRGDAREYSYWGTSTFTYRNGIMTETCTDSSFKDIIGHTFSYRVTIKGDVLTLEGPFTDDEVSIIGNTLEIFERM